MRAMLAQQELEDQINRKKKREAAANYQRELDAQVQAVRQRSIDNLTSKLARL